MTRAAGWMMSPWKVPVNATRTIIALFAMVAAVTVMAVFLRTRPKTPAESLPNLGPQPEQAVMVHLAGTLAEYIDPDTILASLENSLIEVIDTNDLGQYDGNETLPTGTTLFMYGADGEHLFRGIEKTLRQSPLCSGARVVIRRGADGAPQRELTL
jgi:hypothetical protein